MFGEGFCKINRVIVGTTTVESWPELRKEKREEAKHGAFRY
jgi:hypothetical protein